MGANALLDHVGFAMRVPDTSPPPQLPVGWHPDPWAYGKTERYWDGKQWTTQVRRARDARRSRKVLFPLTFAAFLLAVVVVAITMTRSDVESVAIGPASITFSPHAVQSGQPDMQARLRSAQATAESQGSGQVVAADLNGDWVPVAGGGYSWRIYQYGGEVVVEEQTAYGITGVGQGSFDGSTAVIGYRAVNGMTGQAQLQLVDPTTLRGNLVNFTTGRQFTLELRRG